MEQQVIEMPVSLCQLCLSESEILKEYEYIEQYLRIFKDCIQLLSCYSYWKGKKVIYSSTLYYKIQVQKCGICYQERICCKICVNDHFLCLDCSYSYSDLALNNRVTKCPQIGCCQEIDHYIISLFFDWNKFDKWKIFNHTMFCPNKGCVNKIYFSPYSNVKTQLIRINDKQNRANALFVKQKFVITVGPNLKEIIINIKKNAHQKSLEINCYKNIQLKIQFHNAQSVNSGVRQNVLKIVKKFNNANFVKLIFA